MQFVKFQIVLKYSLEINLNIFSIDLEIIFEAATNKAARGSLLPCSQGALLCEQLLIYIIWLTSQSHFYIVCLYSVK